MYSAYCKVCKRVTGFKKNIGVGTAIGAVVTGGLSLLAVPSYTSRCVVCGTTGDVSSFDSIKLQDAILKRTFTADELERKFRIDHETLKGFSSEMVKRVRLYTIEDHNRLFPELLDHKECPYCAETIKAKAIVCRFCGRDLASATPAQSGDSKAGRLES